MKPRFTKAVPIVIPESPPYPTFDDKKTQTTSSLLYTKEVSTQTELLQIVPQYPIEHGVAMVLINKK